MYIKWQPHCEVFNSTVTHKIPEKILCQKLLRCLSRNYLKLRLTILNYLHENDKYVTSLCRLFTKLFRFLKCIPYIPFYMIKTFYVKLITTFCLEVYLKTCSKL